MTTVALLDYEQAAAYLALPIGRLRRLVKLKRVSHYRIGRNVRFAESDLAAWLASGSNIVARSRRSYQASKEHEDAIGRLAPHADRALFAEVIQARFGLDATDRDLVPDAYVVNEQTRTLTLYEVEHRHRIDCDKLRRVSVLRRAIVSHGWSVRLLAASSSSHEWTDLDIDTGALSIAECTRIVASGVGPRFEMPAP